MFHKIQQESNIRRRKGKAEEEEVEEEEERKEEYEGLRVIGCGFGRTGTMSLKCALDILGFSCYHGCEIVLNDFVDSDFWSQAMEKKQQGIDIDFDLVFDGSKNVTKRTWNATCDWPTTRFYQDLFLKYPKAKVILTKRSFDSWYNSILETLYWGDYVSSLQRMRWKFWGFTKLSEKIVWNGTFHGRFLEKEYARKIFEEHIERVEEEIPSERLLVFHPSEGWEPLCHFLEKEVPNVPFPRGNSTEEFQSMCRWGAFWDFVGVLGWLVVVLLVSFLVYHFLF